jgi:hypothetical protein
VKVRNTNIILFYALSAITFLIGFVIGGAVDYSPTSDNPWPSYLSIAFTILSGGSGVISLLVIIYTFSLWRSQQFESEEIKTRATILKLSSSAKSIIELLFMYLRVANALPNSVGGKNKIEQLKADLRELNRNLSAEILHCEYLQEQKAPLVKSKSYESFITALGIMLIDDMTSNNYLPANDDFIFELAPVLRKHVNSDQISFENLKSINELIYEDLVNEIRDRSKLFSFNR